MLHGACANGCVAEGYSSGAHARRQVLRLGVVLTLPSLGLWPRVAQAGNQAEEPLVDAVRTALSAAVAQGAPPTPDFTSTESRLAYLRWLGAMSERLRRRKAEHLSRIEFLQTVWYECGRAGLATDLVLGLIEVESAFRKFAISSVGARGYMQVMPFWMRTIGSQAERDDVSRLFHLQTNLRFGCVILRHYLDRERGDLFLALGRYNGSRGRPEYPNAVFAARRKWQFKDGEPIRPPG